MAPTTFGPLVLILLCTFAANARAQASQDPQAVALATSALAALTNGGQINDITLTGTATRTADSDIETGPITLTALGTADSRMDLVTSGGTRSEIRNSANGTSQGSWIDLDGTSHAIAGQNCFTDSAWFFPALTVLSQLSSANVVATYVGEEARGGASVQHLRFASYYSGLDSDTSNLVAALTTEDVYLDSTSLLPVAFVFNAHPDNDANTNIPVEIDFANYQSVNGVSVPFKIQKLVHGTLFLDITIQSSTLNSGLTDSTFTAQ